MRLNKKGVEALPLRYIIIALVAALVIGIALQFTGILRSGVIGSANKLNDTLTEKTTCELDDESPVLSDLTATNTSTGFSLSVDITDECGVDVVMVYAKKGVTTSNSTELTLDTGTIQDGTWEGSIILNDSDTYNLTFWAQDKAPTENDATEYLNDQEH